MTETITTTQLAQVVDFLGSAREYDPVMPTQMLEVLIVIGMRPGLTMQELSERTGLSQAACSRNVAALSKWHRLGKEGLNFVEAVDDPRERRRKVIYPTIAGRTAISKLMQKIFPGFQLEAPTAREALTKIHGVG